MGERLRLLSWNVNGLRAIDKKGFREIFSKEEFHILALQETKVQEHQIPEGLKDVEGFYSYWSFAQKRGYSGVALYTKTEPLEVSYGIGEPEFDQEGRIIIARYPWFWLYNIYFPNGQMSDERLQYKLRFYEALFEHSDRLVANGERVVICGDFNTAHNEIDLKNPKANSKRSGFLPIERQWMDEIVRRGYVDTFRHLHPDKVEYSWWSYRFNAREKNVGWRIDYFFISQNLLPALREAFILGDIYGSDHCPVGVVLEV